jgi:pimeloyl-ACP methyl ester carboxylesterase
METVQFFSQGSKLTGHLHLPDEPARRAIVVAGSWLTVKEQMASTYARELAKAGFAALAFDFRGFGASEGEPREVESPMQKAEDLRNAAAYLASRFDRVGALVICASAGYLTVALADDEVIRSAVLVAPWLLDAETVRAIYGGEAGVAARLEASRAARRRYAVTGELDYVKAASNTDPSAAMYWEGDFLDYYLNPKRGRVPEWGGRFAPLAWQEWLGFDPIPLAAKARVPMRIITSEGSATPGGAKKYLERLKTPHDAVWLDGDQFRFYDDPPTVAASVGHAVAHFEETLRP